MQQQSTGKHDIHRRVNSVHDCYPKLWCMRCILQILLFTLYFMPLSSLMKRANSSYHNGIDIKLFRRTANQIRRSSKRDAIQNMLDILTT